MKSLGEILEYEQPTKYIVKSENYDDSYATPVLTPGQTFILGYTDEKEGIYSDPLPVIIFDDFTTATKLVNFPFKVKSSAMKILKPANKNVYIPYWYYYLSSLKVDNDLHKRYWISTFAPRQVNSPSFTEQKRIAERLDKVQELIALQKEQLKKLDELIKSRFIDLFGDPITNPKGWPLKRMGDLYYLKAGQTTKANVIHPYSEDYSVPCYGGNGIRGYVQTSTYEGIFPIIGRQGALCGNIQLASGKFHATEHAVLVTPLKGDQPLYVYHLLKDMNLYRFHGGAAQPGLAVKTLNEINIIDVPHNLQTQFADCVTKIEAQKGLLTTRLSHFETLYKSLMQEYFG